MMLGACRDLRGVGDGENLDLAAKSRKPHPDRVRNRSANARTTALSFALWLRKTSYGNSSGISVPKV